MSKSSKRKAFVEPILKKKGWSKEQWAKASGRGKGHEYHTIDNYLNGTTKKLNVRTKKDLADSLGVELDSLPE
jgi:hypothetical protein